MPQNFYDQMDRAGILIDAGFQCCDKWEPSASGRGVTAQDYHVMYLSSLTIGQQLRDHPSVINFSWSDNQPIKEQESRLAGGLRPVRLPGPDHLLGRVQHRPGSWARRARRKGPTTGCRRTTGTTPPTPATTATTTTPR